MTAADWHTEELGQVRISLGWSRRRKGARQLRFIVLGAPPRPGAFRPTLGGGHVVFEQGGGRVVGSRAVLEHGCLSLQVIERIEELALSA